MSKSPIRKADEEVKLYFVCAINRLSSFCYKQSAHAGWWENDRNKAEMICLMHSELSEALEGLRRDIMDDHLPHRKMVEVELADALIRIFDFAGGFNIDLGGALIEKLEYNDKRADHKLENRKKKGGKSF